jgi:hypothetical protein
MEEIDTENVPCNCWSPGDVERIECFERWKFSWNAHSEGKAGVEEQEVCKEEEKYSGREKRS